MSASARLAVEVTVRGADAELVSDELFALGATAVAELPGGGPDEVRLVADLDAECGEVLRQRHLDVSVLEPDAAWDDGWREHARVWRCGERVVLRPEWVAPLALGPDDVEVVIEPGRAFGSGSHATTRLCVASVERSVRDGGSVLDVGCGTGVLGVVAARLGAQRVVALDVEAEAVRVARDLAERNGVGELVEVSTAPLAGVRGSFDVVVANLLAPIIEELASDLERLVAPGGVLVLSGLLVDQRDRALAALPGWTVADEHDAKGWIALDLVRSEAAGTGETLPG